VLKESCLEGDISSVCFKSINGSPNNVVDSYFYGILTMEVICQSPNSEMAISGYSNSTLWAYVSYEPFHCKEGIDFVMQFQINSVCSNGLFMVPTDMQDESRETGTSSKRLHLSTAWTQDR
jgi:hypothetical protein